MNVNSGVCFALLVLFVLLFEVVKTAADHSLSNVLLDNGADRFVVVDLLLALHRLFDSRQLVLDSMLGE